MQEMNPRSLHAARLVPSFPFGQRSGRQLSTALPLQLLTWVLSLALCYHEDCSVCAHTLVWTGISETEVLVLSGVLHSATPINGYGATPLFSMALAQQVVSPVLCQKNGVNHSIKLKLGTCRRVRANTHIWDPPPPPRKEYLSDTCVRCPLPLYLERVLRDMGGYLASGRRVCSLLLGSCWCQEKLICDFKTSSSDGWLASLRPRLDRFPTEPIALGTDKVFQ